MAGNSPIDSEFFKRAAEIVLQNIDREHFSGSELADNLHLSREQTHRKLKKYTGLSTNKFIRYIRLLKAFSYLKEGSFSIAEVSYKVGYDSPAYFNKCFKEEWGLAPGEVMKNGHRYQLTKTPVYKFYQRPEINKFLKIHGIDLDLQRKGITKGIPQKAGIIAGFLGLILIMGSAFFLANIKRQNRAFDLKNDARIAVLPFKNQTGDTLLDHVGEIASSWITGRLAEIKDIKMVPYFTVRQYRSYIGILPNDPQGRPAFSEVVNARYFLSGEYFFKDNKLYLNAELLNGKTQDPVYNLPMVIGSRDSVMGLVEKLRLKVAGLITNLEKVKLGKIKPPGYEAYKYYLKGLKELSVGMYPSKAVHFFEKATSLEPDFVMPQVYLTWFYKGEKRDSVFQLIERIPQKTAYEQKVYKIWKLSYQNNFREALEITLSGLKQYPKDYYFNMLAGHRFKSAFRPKLALKVLSRLHDPLNSDVGLVWHYFKVRNYFESMTMLGRDKEALAYLDSIPEKFHNPAIPILYINRYVKMGKPKEEILSFINNAELEKAQLLKEYFAAAAYEYSLISKSKASVYFASKAVKLYQTTSGEVYYDFGLTDALYLAKDFKGAKIYLKEKLKSNPENVSLRLYLALVEAKLGNEASARQNFAKLGDREHIDWRRYEFEYQMDYMRARLFALLGNKEKAVNLLQKALEKGQLCHYWDFHRDIFLKPLFDYPPFQKLVKPRGIQGITLAK